jgi:hypothetical protein
MNEQTSLSSRGINPSFVNNTCQCFRYYVSSHGVTLSENMTKAKEELKTLCALAPKFGQKLPSEAKIMNATYADIMNCLDICIIDITSGNYQGNTGPRPRS